MAAGRHIRGYTMDTDNTVGTRLLLVDDEETLRKLVKEELDAEGFHVSMAEDGDEALAILGREAFDLLILDIRMPRMGGLSVLQEMQKRGIRPRVIVLTGVEDLDVAIQAARLGANDYVTKPFEAAVLIASIRRVLGV